MCHDRHDVLAGLKRGPPNSARFRVFPAFSCVVMYQLLCGRTVLGEPQQLGHFARQKASYLARLPGRRPNAPFACFTSPYLPAPTTAHIFAPFSCPAAANLCSRARGVATHRWRASTSSTTRSPPARPLGNTRCVLRQWPQCCAVEPSRRNPGGSIVHRACQCWRHDARMPLTAPLTLCAGLSECNCLNVVQQSVRSCRAAAATHARNRPEMPRLGV